MTRKVVVQSDASILMNKLQRFSRYSKANQAKLVDSLLAIGKPIPDYVDSTIIDALYEIVIVRIFTGGGWIIVVRRKLRKRPLVPEKNRKEVAELMKGSYSVKGATTGSMRFFEISPNTVNADGINSIVLIVPKIEVAKKKK